jgi:hypothetical protein
VSSSSPHEPDLRDDIDDGDRVSVTDVNGSIARFEMSYSPPGDYPRAKFGPPWRSRIPSAIYLAGALVLGAVVLYGYLLAPSSSPIFGWVVEGDRSRPIPASVLATIIVVSGLGTALRTHMRGVLVSEEWIEARSLLALGIPRARRWGWPQILRVVIEGPRVAFELWDGSFEKLPQVARAREMVDLIIQHAQKRRIQVTVLDPTLR